MSHIAARTPGVAGSVPCAFTHPLELIPWFRRWPSSRGRDFIYTLIWSSLIALVFTGFALLFDARTPVLEALRVNMVFAQCIGLVIHALFMVGDVAFPGVHRTRLPIRFAYYSGVPIVGVFVGYSAGAFVLGYDDFLHWLFTPRGFASVAFVSLLISAVLLVIILQRERAARAETAVAQEQVRVAAAEQAAATARLKLLEAQVEPHFLFNTLAHVMSLIDGDPANAKHMIERLIALLRTTASSPDGPGTLGGQLGWLRAYLAILELRMGHRLQWRIDVPDELLDLRVAPMLLQPIVENAIKHGLEPKIEGGRIAIRAVREGTGVRLEVQDTGLGFDATRRVGQASLGLANLRARLAAWYGDAARLVIEDNQPAGARVSLMLPASGPVSA